MTYQTDGPIREIPMNTSGRAWGDLIHQVQRGDISYELPYQRGAVWTYEQRMLLIYSILSGTPVPALILNDRPDSMWFGPGGERQPIYAVIDGKQRMMTVRMFMEGDLPVPASWFPADRVEATEDTDDGPYVRYPGLTRTAQRFFENKPAPVAEAHVTTVAEEAAIYLRVNGGGTPQTQDDMNRAAEIAGQVASIDNRDPDNEDREFDARTILNLHGITLEFGRPFTLEGLEALAEVVKDWDEG